MNMRKYRRARIGAILFIGGVVAVAIVHSSYLLAIVGIITGALCLLLVRFTAKLNPDERELSIREKAAHTTYAIFAPTIGIGAIILILFARGRFLFLESLGIVFAYLTLFLIALYAISYHFFNRKYGGTEDKE
jgi:uncharacterized membrane protein